MIQISVVIPVFNKGFILNETLNSVLQQSFTNYGIKAGATYKVTGKHLIDLNLVILIVSN